MGLLCPGAPLCWNLVKEKVGGKDQERGLVKTLTWDVLCCTLCRLDKCYGKKENSLNWEGNFIKDLQYARHPAMSFIDVISLNSDNLSR